LLPTAPFPVGSFPDWHRHHPLRIVITPEREKRAAFSIPIQRYITRIVLGGPTLGPISSTQDLSGKQQVYLSPLTVNYQLVQKLSDSFKQAG
jgi:hypothetical protein